MFAGEGDGNAALGESWEAVGFHPTGREGDVSLLKAVVKSSVHGAGLWECSSPPHNA